MPRKAEIDKRVSLYLMLPMSVRGRLDMHLYSELENRVPQGAYQAFFLERIRDFFDSRSIDLAPYLGTEEGIAVVRGSPETIEQLKRRLEGVT